MKNHVATFCICIYYEILVPLQRLSIRQMTPYELAYEYVMHTNRSIFLTGKAGTGKTTLLRKLRVECPKQMMVVAPTGVAAINAEGVTIHSLFQLPPQLFLPTPIERKKLFAEMQMRRPKQRLLRNLELLVIDEISMVRADLLDTIDAVLRRMRHRPNLPFGGVQMLFIGDLYQLSPVAREDDWNYLRPFYRGPYFFQANVFQEITPLYIELDHVFRQTNRQFIDLLNEVRNNHLSPASLALLNSRYMPDWKPRKGEPFHIVLSTHNRKVDAINARELDNLRDKTFTYHADVKGTFPESQYPADDTLTLKEGARVMFIRSDSSPAKQYYNGKLGVVVSLDKDEIVVECEGQDGAYEKIKVHSETWENIRYVTKNNSDEIQTEVAGTFTHIPLRLAWAVTIHKAQGLTFDHVVIDAADAFAAGQVYVALSRCRTLEGTILLSRIPESALTNAYDVLEFTASQPSLERVETGLSISQREYLTQTLCSLYDFRNAYQGVENLQRLVAKSSSFNRDTANDFLMRAGNAMLDWQHTAEVFQRQIRQILSQETIDWAYLSERLKAADGYFAQKVDTMLTTLKASPVYADDKDDVKSFEEQIEELYVDLARQAYVMGKIYAQPSVQTYFDARRSFAIPKVHISAKSEQKTETGTESRHPELLRRLYALRHKIAEAQGWENTVYLVAHTKTLIEISNVLPTTKKELMAVSGVGKKKYDLIGEPVLAVVKKYLREQQSTIPVQQSFNSRSQAEIDEAIVAAKKNKHMAGNVLTTLRLLYNGNDIAAIARERKMSSEEITGHIAELLQNGIIHISDLSPDDRDTVEDLMGSM